jgi:hypothetical protein
MCVAIDLWITTKDCAPVDYMITPSEKIRGCKNAKALYRFVVCKFLTVFGTHI